MIHTSEDIERVARAICKANIALTTKVALSDEEFEVAFSESWASGADVYAILANAAISVKPLQHKQQIAVLHSRILELEKKLSQSVLGHGKKPSALCRFAFSKWGKKRDLNLTKTGGMGEYRSLNVRLQYEAFKGGWAAHEQLSPSSDKAALSAMEAQTHLPKAAPYNYALAGIEPRHPGYNDYNPPTKDE